MSPRAPRRPPDDPLRVAAALADAHLASARTRRVTGTARPAALARHLTRKYDFATPHGPADVLDDLASMLRRGTVHGGPTHFGPFAPSVPREAVAASTLVAAFNPQRAIRAHAHAAHAIEQHVLHFLATQLGYDPETSATHFCAGGQEANLTALLCALVHAFPAVRARGVRALPGDPIVYASAEAHHGLEKAAHATGLGRDALVRIPVDDAFRLDPEQLSARLAADRARGLAPFAVVATAGTTATGAVDPLPALAALCARERLWLHVDAAFGGAAALSPALRPALDGIAHADSITWDAHKWLHMPLGTGMYFTRHPASLRAAFHTDAPYMPHRDPAHDEPFDTSLAWSRRAAGLPLFVALATHGLAGIAATLESHLRLTHTLRHRLSIMGFTLVSESPLPVVCFTHPRFAADSRTPGDVARALARDGRTWLAPVTLSTGARVLRATIAGADTTEADLDTLLDALRAAMG
jgi:aromatic-L-amino-acid decarboxylase